MVTLFVSALALGLAEGAISLRRYIRAARGDSRPLGRVWVGLHLVGPPAVVLLVGGRLGAALGLCLPAVLLLALEMRDREWCR